MWWSHSTPWYSERLLGPGPPEAPPAARLCVPTSHIGARRPGGRYPVQTMHAVLTTQPAASRRSRRWDCRCSKHTISMAPRPGAGAGSCMQGRGITGSRPVHALVDVLAALRRPGIFPGLAHLPPQIAVLTRGRAEQGDATTGPAGGFSRDEGAGRPRGVRGAWQAFQPLDGISYSVKRSASGSFQHPGAPQVYQVRQVASPLTVSSLRAALMICRRLLQIYRRRRRRAAALQYAFLGYLYGCNTMQSQHNRLGMLSAELAGGRRRRRCRRLAMLCDGRPLAQQRCNY
jgi:hypothetical protein